MGRQLLVIQAYSTGGEHLPNSPIAYAVAGWVRRVGKRVLFGKLNLAHPAYVLQYEAE